MTRTRVFGGLLVLCCGLVPLIVAAEDKKDPPRKTDDPTFVLMASAFNLAEINFSQLAVKQGHSPDVRKFAQRMVDEHTKAGKNLNELALARKWAVASGLDRDHQPKYDRWSRLEGVAFDREYLDGQVKDHEYYIGVFEEEAKNGTDAQAKAWAEGMLPKMRDHLKMARDLHDRELKIVTGSKIDDATFVLQASAVNLAEINFGQLAAKQAHNPDVRKFGQLMVDDHTKAGKELNGLAGEKKWNVASGLDRDHQAKYDRLKALEGPGFDREYLDCQVKDHEFAISLFENEAKNGTDAQAKAWASRALPTLRDHEKMARDLCDKEKKGGDK